MVSSSEPDEQLSPVASAIAATAKPSSPTRLKASSFNAISEKLDSDNYLLWCQQVEPIIKAHRLHHYLLNPVILVKFLTVTDADANKVNLAFDTWEQQDTLLLAWLQSTISKDMLTRVIGCKTSAQIWEKIHEHFQVHTQARSRQLRSELRATTLEGLTISKYLLKIQGLVNSLSAIGEPVSSREHLDIILEGLPQEYESTIAIICGKSGYASISEVETLLLGHESRLLRFNKLSVASASVATASKPSSTSDNASANVSVQVCVAQASESQSTDTSADWRGSRNENGGRGGRGGRGRGRNNTQCQVCHKIGHDASIFYHRFKRDYNAGDSSSQRTPTASPWPPQSSAWPFPQIWAQMLQSPQRPVPSP